MRTNFPQNAGLMLRKDASCRSRTICASPGSHDRETEIVTSQEHKYHIKYGNSDVVYTKVEADGDDQSCELPQTLAPYPRQKGAVPSAVSSKTSTIMSRSDLTLTALACKHDEE